MTAVQLVLKQPSPVAVWPPRIVSKLFHELRWVNTWSRQVTRSQSIVPCETKFWKSHIEKAIWSSSWTIIYENIRQDIRRQFKRHERVERPAASGRPMIRTRVQTKPTSRISESNCRLTWSFTIPLRKALMFSILDVNQRSPFALGHYHTIFWLQP